jgi:hypothetical protein
VNPWTDNERDLLRNIHHHLGPVLANPAGGVEHLRSSHGSGAGGGYTYTFGSTAIRGEWREWTPVQWRPDGRACRWRSGELLRTASVSYARLEAWALSLPAGVRAKALLHWQTHPEWTRDLAALDRVTLAAIDRRPRKRSKPSSVPSECGDQYTLDLMEGAK